MKYMIALASGFAASIVVGFVVAIILGILNIYLTGHGINWPSDEFHWHFIHMSTLDAILLVSCFFSFVGVFALVLYGMSRNWNRVDSALEQ